MKENKEKDKGKGNPQMDADGVGGAEGAELSLLVAQAIGHLESDVY